MYFDFSRSPLMDCSAYRQHQCTLVSTRGFSSFEPPHLLPWPICSAATRMSLRQLLTNVSAAMTQRCMVDHMCRILSRPLQPLLLLVMLLRHPVSKMSRNFVLNYWRACFSVNKRRTGDSEACCLSLHRSQPIQRRPALVFCEGDSGP